MRVPLRRVLPFAVVVWAFAGCNYKPPPLAALPPAVVEVATPVHESVIDYAYFTARTQAVQTVDIKPRVTGYLMKINFKDGGMVKEGDVLFEIDDRPYKATLDAAKASLEMSKASLVKSQADYDIGLAVRKSNPGAISDQELNRRLGSRDESKASVDQALASIESATLNYNWCKVTAPISGRANTHFIDVGNLVTQNETTLTNLVSISPMWAYFDVDENTALAYQKLVAEGKVEGARKGALPVAMGLSNGKDFPFTGEIDFVSNQLDPNTGSIRLRAVFPNAKGDLAAGLFGRIRVPVGRAHDALLVIDRAVGTDQGQKFLLVVNEKDEVEYRPVTVGQLHGGLREVMRTHTTGEGPTAKTVEVLKPTDRVIVNGLQRVRPGAKVEPKPVDMATMMTEKKPAPK